MDSTDRSSGDVSVYGVRFISSKKKAKINAVTPRDLSLENMGAGSRRNWNELMELVPPIGHYDDLGEMEVPKHESQKEQVDKNDEEEEEVFYEEKIEIFGENGALQSVLKSVGLAKMGSLQSEEDKNNARNGRKLADHLTSVPLSDVWHVVSEAVIMTLFVINLLMAIVEMIEQEECAILLNGFNIAVTILENFLVLLMWAGSKHPRFKESEKKEKYEKYQQYIQNIVSELLLYPSLIMALVDITSSCGGTETFPANETCGTNETMKSCQDARMNLTKDEYPELLLLSLDIAVILYSQVQRMYMLRRLISDVMLPEPDGTPRNVWKFAGGILTRMYYSMIGNSAVTAYLIIIFAMESFRQYPNSYAIPLPYIYVIFCIILNPILSLVFFVFTNLDWVNEVLLEINFVVGRDKELQAELQEKYGHTVVDSLHYAQNNIPTSTTGIGALQKSGSSNTMTIFGSLYDYRIVAMLFLWQCFLLGMMHTIYDCCGCGWECQMTFAIIYVVANPHLSLLMILSNVVVGAVAFAFLTYPFFIPFCCRTPKEKNEAEDDTSLNLTDV